MKAAVLHERNKIKFEDVVLPEVKADEVKIKVMACGICGSDTHKMQTRWNYPLPAVMGHEFSGVIVEKGENVGHLSDGERVVAIPFIPCGHCEYCERGDYSLCEAYTMIGSVQYGGFAEYAVLPAKNVLSIGNLDFENAAMIEPSAVALHSVLNAAPKIGDQAAVFGIGTIGMLVIEWLKLAGVKDIIAIDIAPEKLIEAKKMGCNYTINSKKEAMQERVMEITHGKGVDLVFECAGSRFTQEQSLLIPKKKGKVAYVGIAYSDVTLHEKAFENIFRRELTVKGCWNSYTAPFPGRAWTATIAMLQQKRLNLSAYISHRFSLQETQQAFDMMINREQPFNKVMIIPTIEVHES
ncbi:galactitol-1-phosphate 5-dehydrogenase [Sporolactobacillus shoreicorticis]|uniref:Galactitol-1-phosphate 5-dehydrogenase n=1 Tax=Sporolactobacillus shoreicorticis TaxID=1923877 RepID=A0ABW5S3U0_9BACL|nr:galactitol-1-phosphate 5-dehydrogenase [Sporolactobacillus shoreicorticis]MCO7128312.1 galactitol-1-phosphate 5-dehydrogenase [Sporolactobacillus shoreicorticis]